MLSLKKERTNSHIHRIVWLLPALPDRIPMGCERLDGLLGGGFARGTLTLIYGEASTGKTTAVIQAAIATAKRGLKTIYLDSDHSFTQQRFNQIAGEDSPELSQLILLFMPETFSEQRMIVESLNNYVTPSVGLVIIDSISTLYRAAFSTSESVFSLNRDLARQVAYLDEFCSTHKTACVMTSQVHARLSSPVEDVEPVARRTLFHFPQTILRIRNTPRWNVKEFVLEKVGGAEVARTSCVVAIGEKGLSDLKA